MLRKFTYNNISVTLSIFSMMVYLVTTCSFTLGECHSVHKMLMPIGQLLILYSANMLVERVRCVSAWKEDFIKPDHKHEQIVSLHRQEKRYTLTICGISRLQLLI